MNNVGSPTEDFHLINSRPCWAYTRESRHEGRHIPRNVMLQVVRRDGHICQNCRINVPDNEIEFDHIIPYAKGGPTNVENLRVLCRSCNRKKSDSLKEHLDY